VCATLVTGSALVTGASAAQTPSHAHARAAHAVSRLTFGSRPGEVDRVVAMGLDRWIEQQLHPETMVDTGAIRVLRLDLDRACLGMDCGDRAIISKLSRIRVGSVEVNERRNFGRRVRCDSSDHPDVPHNTESNGQLVACPVCNWSAEWGIKMASRLS
jgi:hypothetical protein